MKRFTFVRPETAAEAVAAASQANAVYLGAGTNLLDLMKGNVVRPDILVDVTRLPGSATIDVLPDGDLRIGAAVRNSDLAYDDQVAAAYPAVAEALLAGASAQLRNAATVGGNIMQRTRCAYFYDSASRCNKRTPGDGCDALGGLNRLHAVLGWSNSCIATNPSDFCVPLAAFDALVEIEGTAGRRQVPLEAFHLLPGTTPDRETVLKPGELITALVLPRRGRDFAANARYLKIRERTSYAFAVVSVAAALRFDGDTIAEARIALGGVALKPWRARTAEKALAGQAPSPSLFAEAAAVAMADATPSGDNAFKIELARRTIVRALEMAEAGTPATPSALPASVMAGALPMSGQSMFGGSDHHG